MIRQRKCSLTLLRREEAAKQQIMENVINKKGT
jgi:hypothetical protein